MIKTLSTVAPSDAIARIKSWLTTLGGQISFFDGTTLTYAFPDLEKAGAGTPDLGMLTSSTQKEFPRSSGASVRTPGDGYVYVSFKVC